MEGRQLAFLSASDPPPSREDPRFGGDYAVFRKAYQAWNKRERTRRKAVQPPRGTAAVVGQAAVQQAEATPVKRRRMLPRPNRADFDTEEDFEDAMAERGAARDLRRRDAFSAPQQYQMHRRRSLVSWRCFGCRRCARALGLDVASLWPWLKMARSPVSRIRRRPYVSGYLCHAHAP